MLSSLNDLARLSAADTAGTDAVVRWLSEAARALPSFDAPDAIARRGYARTRLHRSDAFELVLIHWSPGALTALHDHGGERCWFSVIGGAVHVENFHRTDDGSTPNHARVMRAGEMTLGVGEIDYRDGGADAHRCVAIGSTTTLHVYAHPLQTFTVFDEYAETCATVTSFYDAAYE